MRIDVQVTLSADIEINQPVAGDLVEHVVEKRNTGIQFLLAGTVEVQRHPYLGFAGVPYYFGFTLSRHVGSGSVHQAGLQRG